VFADKQASRPQLADPRVLDLLDMQWSDERKVTKGIRFNNIVYGEWHPTLLSMQGQMVRVTYDPNDISAIGVWTPDYKFICRAECEQLVNRNASEEDRREGFRMRAQVRKAMKIVRDKAYLDFANTAQLAIAAQSDAAKRMLDAQPASGQADPREVGVRMVRTPIDGQMDRVRAAFDAPRLLPDDPTLDDAADGLDSAVDDDLSSLAVDAGDSDIDLADVDVD
jgi:hypothetical protein